MINSVYKRRYRAVASVHAFSFNLRQKLTPGRKAAITNAWNKYHRLAASVAKGYTTFIPATRYKRRNFIDRFAHTNKGIVYGTQKKPTTKRVIKLVGKGSKMHLFITTTVANPPPSLTGLKKITIYIPLPTDYFIDVIDGYVREITDKLHPEYISVAIKDKQGHAMYEPKLFIKYLTDFIEEAAGGKKDIRDVLTGFYLSWFKKRVTKKWTGKILRNINTLSWT